MSEEERVCEVCGGPMPEGSRPQKTTCSGKCRTKKARLLSAHGAVPPVDSGAAFVGKEFVAPISVKIPRPPWTALDAAHAAGGVPLDPADQRSKPKYRYERQANRHGKQEEKRIAAGDVNALARSVILSKVPTKKVEDDTIDARLKRLEKAMKQFGAKKQPAKGKGGAES